MQGFDAENPFRLQADSKMVDLGKEKQYADKDDVEEMAEAPDLSWLPQVASEDEDGKREREREREREGQRARKREREIEGERERERGTVGTSTSSCR